MPHVLVMAALSTLLLSPGLISGPSLDASVFIQVAERLRDGATLYADVWDHKPPGIYLLLAAGQTVLPFLSSWTVSWLLSVVATTATGLMVAACCRALGTSQRASLLAAGLAVIVTAQFLLALGGGLTEPFATLAAASALRLSLAPPSSAAARRAIGVGTLLGISLLLSVQVAAGSLAVAALLAARAERPGIAGGWLLAGVVAPIAAVLAWLTMAGALPAAFDAVATYAGAYRAVGAVAGRVLSGPVVAWTLLALLFVVVPLFHGARAGWREPGIRRQVTAACLAWLGLGLVSFVVQGRFLAHYAIPLAVPFGVLSGMGWDGLMKPARAGRAAVLAPIALTMLISGVAALTAGIMEYAPVQRDRQRADAVAALIEDAAGSDARIWVWGNEPIVYLEADRLSVTPYSYLYPLVTPGYGTPELVERTLRELQADPPAFVIDAGSPAPGEPGFQALLIPRPLASDGRDLDLLDPLREFVSQNYRELAIADGWVVYELRGSEAAAAGEGSSQSRRWATRR